MARFVYHGVHNTRGIHVMPGYPQNCGARPKLVTWYDPFIYSRRSPMGAHLLNGLLGGLL
jgi:hypothetical protein